MLATDPSVSLDDVIKTIQRAQFILGEPDDGHKAVLVAPLLKLAIDGLTEIYAPFKPKRGSRT